MRNQWQLKRTLLWSHFLGKPIKTVGNGYVGLKRVVVLSTWCLVNCLLELWL